MSCALLQSRSGVLTTNRFPCVLPFSQMSPLCCIDIRNFLNQFYFFSDDNFQHPDVIDETLKKVAMTLTLHYYREELLTLYSPWTSF